VKLKRSILKALINIQESSSVWLPSEIWRICLRLATLPPSGRSPVDEPRTCLDSWYFPCITQSTANDRTAFCDTLEQAAIYPTKRAVVLVCKAWDEMATGYLYEHIICGFSEKADYSVLIAVLQDGARGDQLARSVIRIDMRDSTGPPDLQHILLRLCPNLQSVYINDRPFYYPHPYSSRSRNPPNLSISPGLLQTPEYERFWSSADLWRYLTICFDIPALKGNLFIPITQENTLPPPPHDNGKEFTNLRRIVFISKGRRYSLRNLKHWPLPSLTHITITSYISGAEGTYGDVLDMLQSSQLGLRLKFFALLVHHTTPSQNTTVSGSLGLLNVMPNLEEVALPFFWVSNPPPTLTVTCPRVHTVGMEINRLDYFAAETPENAFANYAETCCSLFPKMRKIRTTSTTSPYTLEYSLLNKVGPMIHLKKVVGILRRRGIQFEDCVGGDINQWTSLFHNSKES
jgi:hypothetical protein